VTARLEASRAFEFILAADLLRKICEFLSALTLGFRRSVLECRQ
jgi:hypothetical protein